MVGLVTSEFRVHNAKQFIEMFSEPEDNIYFFIAKFKSWLNSNGENIDATPPTPIDSKFELRNVWNEMIAIKKILVSDVSLGLRRYDWTHGTIYDQYDDTDGYLHYKKWYATTSQNQVFACLDNGRRLSGGTYLGVASTYEPFYDPANPTVTIFNTPDGYTWRYMYTISPSEFLKFTTPSWIPCTSVEDQFGKSTGIYSVFLKGFGTGYSDSTTTVTIEGDGTGATATPVIVGGQVVRINITSPGTGYTFARVVITGTNETPAVARAICFGRHGIGSRPAVELGAYYVISSVNLQYGEGGVIPVFNDYRQFGYLRNPRLLDNTVATASLYNMIYRLKVTSADLFHQDETLSVNGGTAVVVNYETADPNAKYLVVASPTVLINVGDTLTIDTRSATVVAVEDQPDLIPGTGDVLFTEMSNPIYRSGDQQESFIMASEF